MSGIAHGCGLARTAPGRGGDEPEYERRNDGQEPKDEHGCHDGRVAPAEADQCARQSQFHDSDAAGGDRDRSDDANERPRCEGFDEGNLRGFDTERAKRNDEDREDAEAAHERGQRKEMPASREQVARTFSEALKARAAPTNGTSADLA